MQYKIHKSSFIIYHGSVLDLDQKFDILVNAANTLGVTGGTIDLAFNQKGGQELINERKKLPIIDKDYNRIKMGSCVYTKPGCLKCNYVIHAVGPDFHEIKEKEGLIMLEELYKKIIKTTKELKMKKVASCMISAGAYRNKIPLQKIIESSCKGIIEELKQSEEEIIFCLAAYNKEELKILLEEMEKIKN